ncbi:SakSTAR [Streptococcus dysgalactiae subsp. dysgalactiae]|uniref:SakSTAR n=1 Tax=Streptococcus dysgalactiae subsp. dysgalactiae TaxID=99822 RepID=A0A380JW51_STRDY|nr:staphylokinase domain-containing protein [Streptococcus dysgalactiae]MCB2832593.1 kinase [Streptococcus dysgalactiae subsp. dysgalactiae]MCB2840367.1 kinase [Streptococcus dysgalactiae subsp. dysgalactiae]MCB2844188.1 kinase [Streptococcus dysgalactiae subsp. dysgalactiae]SUN50694.1 SakSTAR [Streptococcus dysgalactiae subsp. dysgalactiae]
MKKYVKILGLSSLAGLMLMASLLGNEASAITSDSGNQYRSVGKEYREPAGPHLMINIMGVNNKGEYILTPPFTEINLKPGEVVDKEAILKYIQWSIYAVTVDKYRIVKIPEDAQIQVTYYDKAEKDYVTKSYPITESGFVVPDLSEYKKNPSFNLVADIEIEKVN